MKKSSRKIAENGLLIALAIVLGYVETLIPINAAIPGMKIGLTNIVVLYALIKNGRIDAFSINIARILISGFMFGSGISIIYSLFGGIMAYLAMIVAKDVLKVRVLTISVAGAVFHNIGQIIVAAMVLRTKAVLWYLLVLWFTGIISGIVTGIVTGIIVKRVNQITINSK